MHARFNVVGWCAGGLIAAVCGDATAQYQSLNINLYKQFSLADFGNPGNGNSCWGYVSQSGREYAIMGVSNKVAFVDITDPANSRIVATVNHSNSLWADIKTYQNYCYVVNEAGGGIQVIDLSDIDNGVATLVRSVSSPATSHTVGVNEASGFLYPTGSSTDNGGMLIFDLAQPDNPVKVNAWRTTYVHECHVVSYTSGPYAGKEIAFLFAGGSGIYIVDVTNKANLVDLSRKTYPCLSYCHQGWTSDDRRYLFVNDELDEIYGCNNRTTTFVFDISNLSNIQLVNTFSNGINVPDHNLYYRDGLVYESNYGTGLRVWDVEDVMAPAEIAYFDTYPNGNPLDFVGDWGNFPFFPSGTVIVSDMQRGLFVLDVLVARGRLEFSFPDGLPETVQPAGGTRLRLDIAGLYGGELEPGTARFLADTGAGFAEQTLNDLGNGAFEAVFPADDCADTMRFYFSAQDRKGNTYTSPSDAPGNSHSALVAANVTTLFNDNFETDFGWSVANENLSSGAWTRAIPSQGCNDGSPGGDYDGSGRAYITGLGCSVDVDGGPTRLTSPILDIRDGGYVEFAAWFSNDDNDADRLTVEISNNGGTNWTLVESIGNTTGWSVRRYNVADYVSPSSTMRFRFSATDNPNNSVTEAAIDAFEVFTLVCDQSPIECADIKKLGARCRSNGQLKAKVVLRDESHDGQTVAITVDAAEHVLTVNGRRASYKECCFSGAHTVSLIDPAGCGLSKNVDCP
ncbi:MAG: choice-of-anchor B family protein [Phycisphaerae bacterium]|nr:MAG: choice-of-anchor B family protein [Planctomycetota bacterium]KAB2941886.1 MAG: choice-of-anchor B family protein [Phycisphaerae bacterium]MBE7458638.1 choice-of-anchor B family protein [Planctomycetia bacterium]MCK6466414.1 choice-of-anchor B family protein [Phycisphaerae bacterium]MCL4720197.1 choice-of-anchor B family protein [Phycisphaerae bacterium]